ncbi:MAG: ATP-dependent Clp protease ATP-binding subunit [Candidatus Delongbacteria bacterium]|nr:ATP-dependent Clp protease ATP-binding subunit [Candidatus Delongbacteria bacterium]MBN2836259.1 ATP-dependent Clp protease ATP-binding subunit [Candidatus Delongbacteria bacterium]
MSEVKYSHRFLRVLEISKENALKTGYDVVYPEHIMLGLLRLGEGRGFQIIKQSGANISTLRNDLYFSLPVKPAIVRLKQIPFLKESQQIIDSSYDISIKLGNDTAGTEHLLLSLASSDYSNILYLFNKQGLSYKILINLLNGVQNQQNHENIEPEHQTTIESFTRDLTKDARAGVLDPVIGRDKEIERVIQILSRRKKNNPVLIGEPGTGKTAIVEGLARKIIIGDVPDNLKNKRVLSLDLGLVISGTKYRGQFEERLKEIIKDINNDRSIILFLDEIHTLVGAGATSGAMDASNMLKPALARGELQCVGATTFDEYRTSIEKDGALERRFQKVVVNAPNIEQSIKILEGLKERYEEHHKVKYTEESLKAAVILSDRYITDRLLPDKAIDVIDEAGARKILSLKPPSELKELDEKIESLRVSKEESVNLQDFESAAKFRDDIERLIGDKNFLFNNWRQKLSEKKVSISEDDIRAVISMITSIPVSKLSGSEYRKLSKLGKNLSKQIISQDKAIEAIVRRIKRSRAGFSDPNRPIGSFLFLGPTGVGKTELAKVLAEELFSSKDSFIKIDMTEYVEKFNISRMIGSPPGYVGYDEGGQLSEKVRRRPYSVVLFDEIEKAHPDVYGLLLQVLDEGILTDGNGRKIDFKNTIIIFTSNLGTSEDSKSEKIGFGVSDSDTEIHKRMESRIKNKLSQQFKPEFINRLDDIIIFEHLNKEAIKQIVSGYLFDCKQRLANHKIDLHFSDKVKDFITEKYYDRTKGARQVKRAVETEIEDKIADLIINGDYSTGDTIKVKVKGNELVFDK